jgi:hypothetical protein
MFAVSLAARGKAAAPGSLALAEALAVMAAV